MGLVNAQKLVTLMGGRLECEARHSGGTRFWFRLVLPRAQSTSSTDGASSELKAA
jgi:signal transduction histidine kinase